MRRSPETLVTAAVLNPEIHKTSAMKVRGVSLRCLRDSHASVCSRPIVSIITNSEPATVNKSWNSLRIVVCDHFIGANRPHEIVWKWLPV
jgi:hypothetical protein